MKRRDTIKSLLVGGLAGASLTTTGCKIDLDSQLAETATPKTST